MNKEKPNEPTKVTFPLVTDEIQKPTPGGIYVPPPEPALVFQHITVSGVSQALDNIDFPWYWTRLNHSYLDNNPGAIFTVTPLGKIEIDSDTHVAGLRHNPYPVGVVYRSNIGHWYIYNLNLEAMAVGAVFNIAIGFH